MMSRTSMPKQMAAKPVAKPAKGGKKKKGAYGK